MEIVIFFTFLLGIHENCPIPLMFSKVLASAIRKIINPTKCARSLSYRFGAAKGNLHQPRHFVSTVLMLSRVLARLAPATKNSHICANKNAL